LREYDPTQNTYSGREIEAEITYVLKDFEGLKEGWVVFGFDLIAEIMVGEDGNEEVISKYR
jgi:hypothetical protein